MFCTDKKKFSFKSFSSSYITSRAFQMSDAFLTAKRELQHLSCSQCVSLPPSFCAFTYFLFASSWHLFVADISMMNALRKQASISQALKIEVVLEYEKLQFPKQPLGASSKAGPFPLELFVKCTLLQQFACIIKKLAVWQAGGCCRLFAMLD